MAKKKASLFKRLLDQLQALAHVRLGQLALSAQGLEGRIQSVLQILEHDGSDEIAQEVFR